MLMDRSLPPPKELFELYALRLISALSDSFSTSFPASWPICFSYEPSVVSFLSLDRNATAFDRIFEFPADERMVSLDPSADFTQAETGNV